MSKKRPDKRTREASKRAAAERRETIANNLSQPLSEVTRKTDIRTASSVLAKANSFGWHYDAKGNPTRIVTLVNPVGTKR